LVAPVMMVVVVVLSHTFDGIKNIIHDYIHNTKTEIFTTISLKLPRTEILKRTIVFTSQKTSSVFMLPW
jgi:succinate dehydrogenase hydrophobic anchor subunit